MAVVNPDPASIGANMAGLSPKDTVPLLGSDSVKCGHLRTVRS